MAGTNDFLAIATGGGANVISQSAYAALTTFLANGYSSGVVDSDQFNKIIRQSSFISAVIGQVVANSGINAVDDGDIPGFVTDLISSIRAFSPPPGTVIHVAMNTAPTGFLKANGAAISRTTYSSLYSAIGTTFGSGDGSTTFNVPDLRGEFLRGWDDSRGIDSGRVFGTSQGHSMQRFIIDAIVRSTGLFIGYTSSYSFTASPGNSRGITAPSTSGEVATEEITARAAAEDWTTPANTTVSFAQETRPRNISLLACIKY